jgi:betaine-aldehyde dehydrogenase
MNAPLQIHCDRCRRGAADSVLSVLTFTSTKEAVALANQASYGLSVSVSSGDLDTMTEVGRKVRAGAVWANAFMDGFAELPFGGSRQSGLGRELGRNAAADYTEEKTFHVHNGPRANWRLDPKSAA